jgi:hypothetical protein
MGVMCIFSIPDFAKYYNALGITLARHGRLKYTLKVFSDAVRINSAIEGARKTCRPLSMK